MVDMRRIVVNAGAVSLCIGAAVVLTTRGGGSEPTLMSCAPMSYEARLARDEIKHTASPNVGGMGRFHYVRTDDEPPGSTPRIETIHPTVALWTPHGRLLGSDLGEFNGELALVRADDPDSEPSLLYRANIEDLFLMKYGVVATTGYFHLDQDFGSILLVTFSEDGLARVEEIFKLPGGVRASWVTADDKVLVKTKSDTFVVSSPTDIEQVRCKEHWWQFN